RVAGGALHLQLPSEIAASCDRGGAGNVGLEGQHVVVAFSCFQQIATTDGNGMARSFLVAVHHDGEIGICESTRRRQRAESMDDYDVASFHVRNAGSVHGLALAPEVGARVNGVEVT